MDVSVMILSLEIIVNWEVPNVFIKKNHVVVMESAILKDAIAKKDLQEKVVKRKCTNVIILLHHAMEEENVHQRDVNVIQVFLDTHVMSVTPNAGLTKKMTNAVEMVNVTLTKDVYVMKDGKVKIVILTIKQNVSIQVV